MRSLKIFVFAFLGLAIKQAIFAAVPANDKLANAIVLLGSEPALSGSFDGATREPEEDSMIPGSAVTVWYRWTAPLTATARVQMSSGPGHFVMAVNEGTSAENVQRYTEPQLSSNSVVSFRVAKDHTYYVCLAWDFGSFNGRITTQAVDAPLNDFKADAELIVGTNAFITATLRNATAEYTEIAPYGSIWYRWVAPGPGVVGFDLRETPTNFPYGFHVFAYPGKIVGPSSFSVAAGQEIYFQIANNWPATNDTVHFEFNFFPQAGPPPNDNFANRTLLSGDFSVQTMFDGATAEAGEHNAGPRSTWWEYNPDSSGNLVLYTTSQQSTLVAFHGSSLGGLSMIGNPGFMLSVPVTPGVPAQIELGGYTTNVFQFIGQVFSGVATNDNFETPIRLEGSGPLTSVSANFGATTQAGEPAFPSATSGKSLWWSWFPGQRGDATISVGTDMAFYARIFTGTSVSNLTLVSTQTFSPFTFRADPSLVYHIWIDSYSRPPGPFGQSPPVEGPIMVTVANAVYLATANDHFANALALTNAVLQEFFNYDSSREELEPPHSSITNGRTIWFKWKSDFGGGTIVTVGGRAGVANVELAVYEGSSLDSLTPVGAQTPERVDFVAVARREYYIAAETPANEEGVVGLQIRPGGSWGAYPEVNLVQNGSFEEDAWSEPSWTRVPFISVNTGEPAAHGRNFRILFGGVLSQDIPTIPGRNYELRLISWPLGLGQHDIAWMTMQLGNGSFNSYTYSGNFGACHKYFYTAASNSTLLTFTGGGMAIDAISLVDLSDPPQILMQPSNRSALAGLDVSFHNEVRGSAPISFKWYHNGALLLGETNSALFLSGVVSTQAGAYHFVVSNPFGSATSNPAMLQIEPVNIPVILSQPAGQVAAQGSYVSLAAIAAGSSPLSYQWHRGQNPIPGATNRTLIFESAAATNAGTYWVRISNPIGATVSLEASLSVIASVARPPQFLNVANWDWTPGPTQPVFDVDGHTRLAGEGFRAQLYLGTSPESLQAVGASAPFRHGFYAGAFTVGAERLLDFAVNAKTIYAQVRAWDYTRGATYEEARAVGGRFGASAAFLVTVPPPMGIIWERIPGSFSLRAGLPEFAFATLEILGTTGSNLNLRLNGAAGFRYLVEKRAGEADWAPFTLLNNAAGSVNFTDTVTATNVIYRSRILE